MSEQPKRRKPRLARTDFESMTHEQLAALLESASAESASHLAVKLSKAASTITKIGDDLMKHVKGLEWQGEGGDAFRDWGGQTASATLRLGQYSEVASRWMATVSQAITEAKAAMPDTSETTQAQSALSDARKTLAAAQDPGARNDPDARKLAQTAQSDATAAQTRIEAARAEAVQQMRKLAQTYEYSVQQVNSVTPPTFSPPADHLGSKEWRGGTSQSVSLGSTGSSTTSAAAYAAARHDLTARDTTYPRAQAAAQHATPGLGSQQVPPSRSAAMEIDSVGVLPQSSNPGTAPSSTPPTGGPHRDLSTPGQPGVIPPAMSNGGRAAPPPSPTRAPSSPRLPHMPGPGTPPGGAPPRMPRETGITGGRPVASAPGRSANSLPGGTVIGKEGLQGRSPMMRGMTPGVPAGGGPGHVTNPATNRRLASEAGGVVGNRPVQPSHTGGRPFTPGGSGLVRPSSNAADPSRGAAAGRTGAASSSAHTSSRRKDRQGQRPDYLAEDEETWVRDDRRNLPPVIG
ncbi:hypothetical protein [Streptomyces sp. CC219B]|uniref:hypothetical protein n=1 Tax=Streptomyces sp. CC219B TaxID=3044574 RepID=UPI0024A9DDD4|nr:hypothetical protein [Streptomyces sp. CC219B]